MFPYNLYDNLTAETEWIALNRTESRRTLGLREAGHHGQRHTACPWQRQIQLRTQVPGLSLCPSPKAPCPLPDFSRMSMNAVPRREELVNPTCPLLWQLQRLSRGLLSGSDVSLPINSRLRDSQAQTRKSTSFLGPFPPAKKRRKGREAEGNPGDVQNGSKL